MGAWFPGSVPSTLTDAQLRRRYRHIVAFFARITAGFIWWEIVVPRLGLRSATERTRPRRTRRAAARFRALAVSMGGLMIKVGQFLSARLDVLPAEVTDELSGLQDEVPPADLASIRALAEAELGGPLAEVFARFEDEPLAAASLGQAHRAVLLPSDADQCGFENVVVKVQRPDIARIVDVDLSALRRVGRWLTHYRPISTRADVPALVEEFAHTTLEEIDYRQEARNAGHFEEAFADDPGIRVPQVVWERSTTRVLTLEDVSAIRLGDHEAISDAGIDRGEVARRLVGAYLQQIVDDGVFHADPHPGNLFVEPLDASGHGAEAGQFRLTFVDFGMVGRVPENLRQGLREALVAVATQDAARLVSAFRSLDVLIPGADQRGLELAAAQVFDRFGGMSMESLQSVSHEEMMSFGLQFRDLMVAMPFQLPENLLLLGRCVAMLSGQCTGLDPSFNLWQELTPYANDLISDETADPWTTLRTEGTKVLRQVTRLPARVDRVMTTVERGELAVRTPMLDLRIGRLERTLQRMMWAIVFAGLVVAGALLHASEPVWGTVLLVASALPLGGVMFPRRRRPGP